MDYKPIHIPTWIEKGKTAELLDGNIVTFAGKNPRDYCIIVKDKNEKIHVNFTIKPDEYEFHIKNEVTGEKHSLFEVYSSVIEDLVKYWMKEKSEFIKIFSSKKWRSHNEFVVDINSAEIPAFRFREGIYNLHPDELLSHTIVKKNIIRLRFSMGVIFDKKGNCLGMLMPIRKAKMLVWIQKPLFMKILDTVIGIDFLRISIKEEYDKMKNDS